MGLKLYKAISGRYISQNNEFYYIPTIHTADFTPLYFAIKSAPTDFTTNKSVPVLHRPYANQYVFIRATR